MKQYIIIILTFALSYSTFSQEGQGPIGDPQLTFNHTLCKSFYMLPGETYIVSAWVKESHAEPQKTYTNGIMRILFYDAGTLYSPGSSYGEPIEIYPSGKIIDGWQRIIGLVNIPEQSGEDELVGIGISFANLSTSVNCYFDDFRVFPYNGTMKSFVYDEDTQRLVAELDENNYATFYEYDKEGGLIRVKKETEDGIYTIQETRSSTKKQQ